MNIYATLFSRHRRVHEKLGVKECIRPKGVKLKTGARKLRSDVNWQKAFQQKRRKTRTVCIDILIYLSTAIGLTPGSSGTVHTIHRTTQIITEQHSNSTT